MEDIEEAHFTGLLREGPDSDQLRGWHAAMIACVLLALDGDLAKAEPKTQRYRVLHAAASAAAGTRSSTQCSGR